jgi:hypothetical protein
VPTDEVVINLHPGKNCCIDFFNTGFCPFTGRILKKIRGRHSYRPAGFLHRTFPATGTVAEKNAAGTVHSVPDGSIAWQQVFFRIFFEKRWK